MTQIETSDNFEISREFYTVFVLSLRRVFRWYNYKVVNTLS